MEGDKNSKVVVLIDAENISSSYTDLIFDEISKYGIVIAKRIYGDWSSSNLNSWRDKISQNALQAVQQFQNTTGKNSSDSALIIDAMDLLYSRKFDVFAIVSSDGDFTKLITRIKENGIEIVGLGEQKTPKSLLNACDKFVFLDVLFKEKKAKLKAEKPVVPKTKTKKIKEDEKGKLELDKLEILKQIIDEEGDEDGYAFFSNVINRMLKRYPEFDPRNYGHKKTKDLFLDYKDIFHVKSENINGSNPILKIKVISQN